MQWDGNQTYSYEQFKVCGVLNTSTGELTITGLTRNDSGSYTAEINNQVTKPIQLLVISRVSRPSVSTWCDPEMTYCVFTCKGNTSDAEPITFGWEASDMMWHFNNTHIITKDETETRFSCYLQNPVSFMGSESVRNPFYRHKCIRGIQTGSYTSIIIFFTMCAVIILVLILLIWLTHKCRKGADAEGTTPEKPAMLPHGQETPLQEPPSVVTV
ncbi:Carcinoembryonic antigen-related cell adhesion molecule 1 [Collichthys lucidus]|uniref:Carcinoembryonic antigen-related cell adhesion molecule 1 n=1 Tax=Collichthys lucidus TaxID=240159 RepID=A0A4U5TXG6_COLLU|nr:Carcinoembryonic antigen-related cell adhesion molecule 1 [Collichthys lucidus]